MILQVWNGCCYPSVLVHSAHMDKYDWNDAFMSQFSYDDKLLMVTGDKSGSYYKGDVAIFDLKGI